MNLTIGFPHRPPKQGGPGVFQNRFETVVKSKGWRVVYPDDNIVPDVVLVVGGTKRMGWLLKLKQKKVPIIYRLDGMSWLHREKKSSVSKWITSERGNLIMKIIRSVFASYIVYQSDFVKQWWSRSGWWSKQKNTIIYNGVDINKFKPRSVGNGELSILCIEGNIDYTPFSIDLLNALQKKLIEESSFKSLILYGNFESPEAQKKLSPAIDYRGSLANDKIAGVYKDAIYLSLDINAACPNTVIEALASGIPVLGFDSGALKELVDENPSAGEIVAYGGDPWKIDFPDVNALIDAAHKIKENWEVYSKNARKSALQRYDMENVVNKYVEIIKEVVR